MRVLFVTDTDRSLGPLAVALWQRETATDLASSVGLDTRPDQRASATVAWAAAARGLDLSAHRTRPVDAEQLAAADLILTLTRAQADLVGATFDRVADRLFLVGELAALLRMDTAPEPPTATLIPPTATTPSTPAAASSDLLALARTRRLHRGIDGTEDDHPDPGEDPAAASSALDRLAADLATIAEHRVG